MAVILDATVGGASANSYATVAEGNAYAESRPDSWSEASTWDDADDDQKARALVTATSMLDEFIEWEGAVQVSTQVLGWPRIGLLTPNGWLQPHTEIPERVKRATCELAIQLLVTNRGADSDADVAGLKALKAGPVEMEFRNGIQAKAIPDRVWRMVAMWGALKQYEASVPIVQW